MLIAIEGIDGSGKGTQARRLVESLNATGRSAALFGFPRYSETFFGARIGEFLNGRFGTLGDVSPLLVALLFAGDRYESRGQLQELQRDHEFVVLDRYVASNIAHQAAKVDGTARAELVNHIEHLEFTIYGLPRPDRVILLDLDAEKARELVGRKARRDYTSAEADLQESDTAYQTRVRSLYLELSRSNSDWHSVCVTAADGSFRGVDEIAAEVRQLVAG